ncbi:MAG: hypothetical protein ACLSH6_08320 [Limosilactobacillus pontis]
MDAKVIPTTTTNAMREVTTNRSQTKSNPRRPNEQHTIIQPTEDRRFTPGSQAEDQEP